MKVGGNSDVVEAIERLTDKSEAIENSIDAVFEVVEDMANVSADSQEIMIEVGGELVARTEMLHKELSEIKTIFEEIAINIQEHFLSEQDDNF